MLDKQIVASVVAAGLTFFQGLLEPVPAKNPAVSDTKELSWATYALNVEAQQEIENQVVEELFRRYRARYSFFVSSRTIRKAIEKQLQEHREELNRYFGDLHACSTPWNLFLDYMERYHPDQIAQIPKAP